MERKVYERHIKNQKNHWWFSVRRNLISTFIRNYSKKKIEDFGLWLWKRTNIIALTKFGKVYAYER